ncbi:ComEC/Rec2 family competence protein, partial [Streptomyces sp. SID14436]
MRHPVHAASGHRLGASHPRQEAPADLRLVVPALAVWATAALTLHATPGRVAAVAVLAGTGAGVLMLLHRSRPGGDGATTRTDPNVLDRNVLDRNVLDRNVLDRNVLDRDVSVPTGARITAAAALLGIATAAVAAGLHGADLRRGPVPDLAREYARVTAEVEITADPRRARPGPGGGFAPPSLLIEADVRTVERAGEAPVEVRTPVLVIVDDRSAGRDGASARARPESEASPWLALLPSTRLRVEARLTPTTSGDRFAAVLRTKGAGGPEIVGEPSGAQRLAGRLRAGLREATDDLPADARALLPGLVVGDTARVPPDLDEAFRETDLTHTLAVSGANFTILLALFLGPPGLAQQAERRGLAPRIGLTLRGTAVLGGALSLAFVIVCRPDPSVLRAAACGSVALLALATGRRRSLIPALAAAVLLLVLYDPWLSRSYGFLLSVLATGALLTMAPRWSEGLRRRGLPPRLAEALAAAGAAQA